ncbi:undecaprenyl-phosphate galactose phosphotransferase WbaP [Synechococcus sp. PCC 6312]|uniref:undecaprenyl-phosphate galactose phosphotransferase WbaP n=1 Tax=Synechococcus sp. (strain ATCC 27167 / PCC 6312) TaxID=195253 RepID=UPI00029F073E|nr:undecaprenyl-phosphate galactose phosphotransferase WbaP [Synechococcus sp. PCC 6312]AFY59493.1 Undecaprenyl-phosphate galactose phosphotransferase, WbaP/exopolysaccharide biosynthesis polyprenyl glycosylphosphotransferase [Synechococcus sp. PCC 6312]
MSHSQKQPLAWPTLRRGYAWMMSLVFLGGDVLSLGLAVTFSVWGRWIFDGQYHPSLYLSWLPLLVFFPLSYAIVGLYPGVGMSPVDELRWLSLMTTLVYTVLGSVIFLVREGETYSRLVFLIAWVLSLLMMPMGRGMLRHFFSGQAWWGQPVIILGAGKTGELVLRTLLHNPGLGLKPVILLDDDPAKQGEVIDGVSVLGGVALAPELARYCRISYAIVAMPGVDPRRLVKILENYGHCFEHLLVIPDLFGLASLWVESKDLAGLLSLEVRQQLLLPVPRFTKACIDFCLSVVIGLACLPLLIIIGCLIYLDCPGPIFYTQARLGRNGKTFYAVKFRSMLPNADQILTNYLARFPEYRQEWEEDHKLKQDPRLTRVGWWLRRTSLDELPQLWNVLRGEMSLVGPRPIVTDEVPKYEEKYALYTRVKPGITGLWQVSGRNNISYEERVNLDAYYVRNWSVWLDFYILLRTVWVVLMADGAY